MEKNKDYYLSENNVYPRQVLNNEQIINKVRVRSPDSTSSDTSDVHLKPKRNDSILRSLLETGRDNSDINAIGTLIFQNEINEKAFDVISNKSPEINPIDSYDLTTKESDTSTEVTSTSAEDEILKDWSSDEGIKLINKETILEEREESIKDCDDSNLNSENSDTMNEEINDVDSPRKLNVTKIDQDIIMNELSMSSGQDSLEINFKINKTLPDNWSFSSPKRSKVIVKSELDYSTPIDDLGLFGSPRRYSHRSGSEQFSDDNIDILLESIEKEEICCIDESMTITSDDVIISKLKNVDESVSTLLNNTSDYVDNSRDIASNVDSEDISNDISMTNISFTKIPTIISESFTKLDVIRDNIEKKDNKENNEAPAIIKIEQQPTDNAGVFKKPKYVLRNKSRNILNKSNTSYHHSDKATDTLKNILHKCFEQLDNKDWEVTIKGLQSLSQLAKQHPEYLDNNIGGTVARLLGRHIKSLRSQVARAACTAAGDIFSCQIRSIDQDIDDIVGPLLHRTADTNRFLRFNSNTALDKMVESLPPHKTIAVIVIRGANHQNAIVRATTARLLSSIVERIGAEHAMMLPRDVRDKLMNSGAKLLMDGNLEARNHAKKIFRQLMKYEGFQKALNDAVPEKTLRHIDKTLKSL